jgi:hypothetical protein
LAKKISSDRNPFEEVEQPNPVSASKAMQEEMVKLSFLKLFQKLVRA